MQKILVVILLFYSFVYGMGGSQTYFQKIALRIERLKDFSKIYGILFIGIFF